jgi:hypothetical protein
MDNPALVAISTMTWVSVDVSHEIIGHAGSAALLGIPVRAVSTTTTYIYWDQVSSIGAYKTINAAGTLMNLIVGVALTYPQLVPAAVRMITATPGVRGSDIEVSCEV